MPNPPAYRMLPPISLRAKLKGTTTRFEHRMIRGTGLIAKDARSVVDHVDFPSFRAASELTIRKLKDNWTFLSVSLIMV